MATDVHSPSPDAAPHSTPVPGCDTTAPLSNAPSLFSDATDVPGLYGDSTVMVRDRDPRRNRRSGGSGPSVRRNHHRV